MSEAQGRMAPIGASDSLNRLKATGWFLVACVLYAGMVAVVRLIGKEIHPAETLFIRNIIATLMLLPSILPLLRAEDNFRDHHWFALIARGAVSLFGMLLWFWAVTQIPLADAVALHFSMPLLTVLGGMLLLRETVGIRQWIAIACGLLGVFITLQPALNDWSFAYIVVLLSAAGYAGANMFGKKLAAVERPAFIILTANIVGLPLSGLLAIPVWTTPNLTQMGWLLSVGVMGTLAHLLQANAFRLAPVSFIMPLDFTRLPLAAGFAFMLFDEIPSLAAFVGGAVIFFSALYINRTSTPPAPGGERK